MDRYEKHRLLGKIGGIDQVAGVRPFRFSSGRAAGTEALEVYNAAGLRFTVLPDQCMNLLDLSWRGTNLGFLSKNGLTGERFASPLDREFLYRWPAGMLYTCGLASTGPPNLDEGLYRTEHGRIGLMPAENLSVRQEWEDGDFLIRIRGTMRESMLFGYNLRLTREISVGLLDRHLIIEDTLENLEPAEEPFMLLYHANFGFPLVDEGAEVVRTKAHTRVHAATPPEALADWNRMGPPVVGAPEHVFYHVAEERLPVHAAGVLNDRLGLGAFLRYSSDNLPILVQWKCPRSHDYVIGLEPSNSFILGRAEERKNGTIRTIPGYGTLKFRLEIGVLAGASEMERFRAEMG